MKTTIPIKASVFQEIFGYAHAAYDLYKCEIAGWGHFDKKGDNGIYKLAPLPPQETAGAEVDSFPDEILALASSNKYDMSDMIVQWHSHMSLGCTPSVTDNKNIDYVLGLFPIIITIIVNVRDEYSARISYRQINGITLGRQDIDVELMPYYNDDAIKKEVKSKLSYTEYAKDVVEIYDPSKQYPYYDDWFGFDPGYISPVKQNNNLKVIPNAVTNNEKLKNNIIDDTDSLLKNSGIFRMISKEGIFLNNKKNKKYVWVDFHSYMIEFEGTKYPLTRWAFIKSQLLSNVKSLRKK